MSIAMIVSLATFALVEVVMKRSGDIGARVDTTASAPAPRWTRSRASCARRSAPSGATGAPRSIDAAAPTSLTVYADFSNETRDAAASCPRPTCARSPGANNIFTESVVKGTRARAPTTTSATPRTGTSRPFLHERRRRPSSSTTTNTKPIIFRYYQFPDAGTVGANRRCPPRRSPRARTARSPTPSSSRRADHGQLRRAARRAATSPAPRRSQNDIYVRTADPNAPTPKPTCLTY